MRNDLIPYCIDVIFLVECHLHVFLPYFRLLDRKLEVIIIFFNWFR